METENMENQEKQQEAARTWKIRVALWVVIIAAFLAFMLIAKPILIPSSEPDPAQKLGQTWLSRLSNMEAYELAEAEFYEYEGKKYLYMTYSLKPKEGHLEEYNAGNGEEQEDGWIREKNGYIGYSQIGLLYFFDGSYNTGL